MDENKNEKMEYGDQCMVPYAVVEDCETRNERREKRLFKVIFALIIYSALITAFAAISNYLWLRYEQQFEDVVITQENTDGFNSYIGNDGDIYNGYTDNQEANP